MRYEVGRDAALRLDPGATRLAVGLDFAIFALEHNIEVIQDGHLRDRRHWSRLFLRSGAQINWYQPHLGSDHERMQAGVFTSQSPAQTFAEKTSLQVEQTKGESGFSERQLRRFFTSGIGHDRAPEAAADVPRASMIM